MNWLKHKLSSLIYTNKKGFTLQKILVLLAVLNALLQVAFGNIHNQAAYKVSSTVAIYTFINQIALILTAVSLMRVNEKKRYFIFFGNFIYFIHCFNDFIYRTNERRYLLSNSLKWRLFL